MVLAGQTMGTIFFSHDSRDKQEALSLAIALEEQGYRTWVFEIDTIAGVSYITQTLQAIENSLVFMLLITNHAVTASTRQVEIEIVRAHETGKPFLPLLLGLTHSEFQKQKPEWHHLLGGATSLMIPASGVSQIRQGLVPGLERLGVSPGRPDDHRLYKLEEELQRVYRSPEEESAETLLDPGDYQDQRVIVILQKSPPEKSWEIDGKRLRKIAIGRDATNDIIVSTKTTSRKHAMIIFDTDRGWIIKDLNSTNKTRVNGEPIQEIELQCDDLIEIGNTCFIISQLFKPV
jgi:hypothetical protein